MTDTSSNSDACSDGSPLDRRAMRAAAARPPLRHDLASRTGTIAAAIANAVTRLHKELTGRGPTSCRAVIDDDLVTVLLRDTLTSAERRLIAGGKADMVEQLRREYHAVMGDSLIAAVEMLTERGVIALLSAQSVEVDVTTHSFVLAPESSNGKAPPGGRALTTDGASE